MNTHSKTRAVILIIDADPLTLTAVAAVLDMNGYECHCARDAEAALKAVRGLSLDLVICDIDLDGEDGLALVRELQQEENAEEVPFLFLSSADLPDAVQRAHEAGAAYYLRKPFDPYVLIDLVDRALWMPHLVRSRMRNATRKRTQGSAIS